MRTFNLRPNTRLDQTKPAVLASKHPVFLHLCVWMTCVSPAGVPEGGAMCLSFIFYLLLYLFVFFMVPISIYLHLAVESKRLSTLNQASHNMKFIVTLTSVSLRVKVKEMLRRRKMWNLHVELAGLLHALACYRVALIIFSIINIKIKLQIFSRSEDLKVKNGTSLKVNVYEVALNKLN